MVSTTLPKLEQFLSDSQLHTTLLVSDPHHCTSVNTCTTMARNQDVTIFGRKNTMETSGGGTRLSASGAESLSMEGANLLRYVCVYLAVGGGSSVKTESLANGPASHG
jgi:hypothetical protein